MQAKDLDDVDVLRTIDRLGHEWAGQPWPPGLTRPPGLKPAAWCMRWDLDAAYPEAPSKVVLAKCKALIRRRLLDGCTCGCRGDYELTDLGRAFLEAA